jgi:hypothetical protein
VTAKITFLAPSRFASRSGFSIALRAASVALFSQAPYPIPNNAFPESLMIVLISAKSILISPGFIIKSDIP